MEAPEAGCGGGDGNRTMKVRAANVSVLLEISRFTLVGIGLR